MEYLVSLISLDRITALPIIVSGPGLLLVFLFLVRAIRSLFSLRLITVFTSLVYAFVIALILSSAGEMIVQLLGIDSDRPSQSSSQSQDLPDNGRKSLAQLDSVLSIQMHPIQG